MDYRDGNTGGDQAVLDRNRPGFISGKSLREINPMVLFRESAPNQAIAACLRKANLTP
jgi:hypothetical protein